MHKLTIIALALLPFSGFSLFGCSSGSSGGDSSTDSMTSNPDGSIVPAKLVLRVENGGNVLTSSGALDCGESQCTYEMPDGHEETFSAVAQQGYVFTGWEGACSKTTEPCTMVLDSSEENVLLAHFGVLRDDGYIQQNAAGFTVIINEQLFNNNNDLAQNMLTTLRQKLTDVIEVTPKSLHEFLYTVKFWVEEADPEFRGMTYHPGLEWLLEHGRHPEKLQSVEIYNSTDFLMWEKDQPWFVLHELAHALHHQIYTFEEATVYDAYENALSSGLYANVEHADGSTRRAYALTNRMEYFAEISEAYFGLNDAYPFVKQELRSYDMDGYLAVEELWNLE